MNNRKARKPTGLPAPKGPVWMAMRLYWPKDGATEGKWIAPPLMREQ